MSSPDYSQDVKDIIDGLGDSPTPDQIYHAVRNYSVDNVVAAAASAAKAGGGGGGGGSQAVQWVDGGAIDVTTFTGRVTLYTTAAGEFISSVRFGDVLTYVDGGWVLVFEVAGYAVHPDGGGDVYAVVGDSGSVHDSAGQGIGNRTVAFNNGTSFPNSETAPPLLAGALTVSIGSGGFSSRVGASATWQANHVYADVDALFAAGHYWDCTIDGGGTSGGSIPDFAGHIGGNVLDGTVRWYDEGTVPTVGAVHPYIEVVTAS